MKKLLLLGFVTILFAGLASGASLCTTYGSLSAVNTASGCQDLMGNLYNNFSVSFSASATPAGPLSGGNDFAIITLANMEANEIVDGSGNNGISVEPSAPIWGFFAESNSTPSSVEAVFTISYDFTPIDDVAGITLGLHDVKLTPSGASTPSASGAKSGSFTGSPISIGPLFSSTGLSETTLATSLTGGVTTTITDTLTLVSGGTQKSRAEINAVSNTFTVVPEPSTYILMSSGLFALGLLRRRFRNKK